MKSQDFYRTIKCPKCQLQITIHIVDFQGALRIRCDRCRRIICDSGNYQPKQSHSFDKDKTIPRMQMQQPPTSTAMQIPSSPDPLEQAIAPFKIGQSQRRPAAIQDTKVNIIPNLENPQKQVGKYQLLKQIARGAMGEIYLARNVETANYSAVKLLSQKMQRDGSAVKRFYQEARVHSRLVHPNIVRIFEVGCCLNTKRMYLVMEYVDGESLEIILSKRSSISPRHALKIAIAVAHALEHALEQKIIHRDLKPANILIDKKTRKVKVADLGLGKILEEKGVTLSGELMGTAYYMPPEQIRNAKEVDHRADIYALGATLYHMVAGRPPYSEYKGTLNILKAKVGQPPLPLQEFNPEAPECVIKIIEKAMSHNIAKRYANPTVMIEKMQKALEIIKAEK